MVKQDYYSLLGVEKSADAAAIKKAYRKLAKKYHPDTHEGDKTAEERFKEITEAYEVLSDPKKRKLYDQFGHAAFDGSMGSDPEAYQNAQQDVYRNAYRSTYQNAGNQGTYQEFHFSGKEGNMEDLFENLFGHGFHSGGNGFSGFRRTGGMHGGYSFSGADSFREEDDYFGKKYSDVTAEIEIDFEDAVFGADRKLQMQDSTGKIQTLEVHIPAGIDSGKKIRLKGKGNVRSDGSRGDLYLEVILRKKAGYERKGNDVYTTADIPFTTAVFGGEAIVPTLYGNVKCRIPEGAQSGSKIRLRGKGMPLMKQPSKKGDEYVTIQIQVPRDLNTEAKRKLREFASAAQIAS